ncbi:hypothetical protein TNCV_1221811 [Trichonephila clavipes]|nr:hypothetical protein TNCV_1221811 [Trichonephila clavipes]
MIDNQVNKTLGEGTGIRIQSSYASPVVLCHRNNERLPESPEYYRFGIDYHKFHAIYNYPHYPLQIIKDFTHWI